MKKLILLLLFIPLVGFGQVKNGEVKTYYESGKLFSVANWKNDKEDGLWKVYYENGQLKVEQNYKDGVLHKEIEFNWDENSSYEIKVTDYIDEFKIVQYFKNNHPVNFAYMYKNGILVSETRYIDGKEGKDYHTTTYNENGEIIMLTKYRNEVKNGLESYYDSEGEVSLTKFYAHGVVTLTEGPRIKEYNQEDVYDDGEIFYLKSTNELLNGVLLKNYPGGIRQAEFTIENGVFNGKMKRYYIDGSLKTKGFYENGKQNDTWYHYYGSGNYMRKLLFDLDGKQFMVIEYRDDSNNTKKRIYTRTSTNSTNVERFDINENLTAKGDINEDGEKNGFWEYFDVNGKKLRSGGYVNGKKNGPWMEYNSIGEFNMKFYKDGKVFQY